MFENKIIEDNKILISNLKARMFRGYHKIIKNSKSHMHKNKNYTKKQNSKSIYTPQRKQKEKIEPYIKTYTNRFPTKINKEILPFEREYEEVYKKKYLGKYNNLKLKDLKITNLSKKNNKLNNIRRNKDIYLTESKNYQNVITNINNKETDKNNIERTLNILFPYKEEINQLSNLPFFSLIKNPNYLQTDLINSKGDGKKNIKDTLQEDFLYKISHKRENEQKFVNNNFNKNKGLKKGATIPLNDFNKMNKKNLKLQLDIQNIYENSNVYLNPKEKRYKILEKEIEPLKNIVSLFKDFENNFLNDDYTNNENTNINNNSEKRAENNIKTILTTNIINVNEKNIDNFDEACRRTYNFKKPKLYPINYYSATQLKTKEKKYESAHKLAFEEYQKKINLKDENLKGKTSRKNYELDEYEKEYFNKLFNKKEMTNKIAFLRECRIRDIILTNKLKCEFSPSDIKRVLNGLKPWNDCEKLDKRFLMKKLPKSVEDFKIN